MKQKKKSFIVCSHRGGSQEQIENTLEAIQFSKQNGIEFIWLDVSRTKDNQLVTSTEDLKRLCYLKQKNFNKTFHYDNDEFPPFKGEIQLDDFSYGIKVVNEKADKTDKYSLQLNRAPLLKEVFLYFSECQFILNLEQNDEFTLEETYKIILENKMKSKVVWGSLKYNKKKPFQKFNLPEFTSNGASLKYIIFMLFGILPYIQVKEKYFQFVIPQKRWFTKLDQKIGIKKSRFYQFLFQILPFTVKHLQRRNIIILLRVANSEQDFNYCKKIGANIVLTDRPAYLTKIIQNKTKQ